MIGIHHDQGNQTRFSEIGGYVSILDFILWVTDCFEPADNHSFTDQSATDMSRFPLAYAYLVSDTKALLEPPKFNFANSLGDLLSSKPVPHIVPASPAFTFRSRYNNIII